MSSNPNTVVLSFGSRNNNDVETPKELLDEIRAEFGENMYDPCPLHPTCDGLTTPWGQLNFVNPPYNNIKAWVAKAEYEWKHRGNSSLILIPFRSNTHYWKDHIWNTVTEIYIYTDRIKFQGYEKGLPVAMCLVKMGKFSSHTKTNNNPKYPYRAIRVLKT